MNLTKKHAEYIRWVNELKTLIQKTQIKASISVNRELLGLYWTIGKSISDKVNKANWGSSVVEELSKDLKVEFPNQKGFSRSNLFSMKKWFEFYSKSEIDIEKIQQLVGQIPWGQNVVIISKSKSIDEAVFYSNKTIENNWSRSVLIHQIELEFYERHGKAITNFTKTLPTPHSELATETLKDPYKFDFLTLQEKAVEKDIENQLVKHITSFLLELGTGFSFVGQQVPVKIDNQDFYIDLLFYHIKLKCYVVVELKAIEFKAEFAGKMNLYLSAIDDSLKTDTENPTIGLLLCKSKSEIIAEYSLRGMTQPIGIAEYEINKALPKEIEAELPTIEEIELATTKAIRNADDSDK
ncbi:MAG: PDDEXK nuclease domain-containing protein [candidate division Zixibacteria bacterium]|nr:PDDEXK nuclease domain-containing protein [candidate division Zixibacteria bacterium]